MAVRAAAALSGGIRGRDPLHPVVRRKECAGHRLEPLGYRRLHHLPLLFHQAGGQILQGGQALQRGAKGRGLLEAHQTPDENARAAGCPADPGGTGGDAERTRLLLWGRACLLRPEPDGPPRRYHWRHRPGGLRQIHAGQGVPLRAALRRQHPAGRPRAGGAVPLGADGPRGVSGPRSGAVQRHDPGKCAAGRHGRSHGLPPGCVSGRRSGGHDGGAGDPGGHRRRPAFRRSGPAAGAGPDAGPSKTPADSGRSLFGAGPGHGDGDLRPSAASGGGQRGDSDLSPAVSVPGAGSGDLAGKRGGQGGDPRGIGGEYPGLCGAV